MDLIDTTSRLQVADSPAGSEDRFRALIEKSPEAITLLSADGTVLYVSPSTSRMTGYDCDDLIGRSGFDFLHPDDLARAKDLHADLLKKPGRHIKAELRLHHKDGSWRWVEAIGTNLLGAPQVNAIVASYHDVTERKRMEEALKTANDQLAFWARELEWRNRELSLLSEMGGLLQACVTEKEAYQVIARSAPELFPEGSGAVYIVDRSKDLAEALAVWGKNSTGELVFPLNDCWALRRGRVHAVEGADISLFCQHLRRRPPAASLCVPMVAQGEILGVLHLYFAAHDGRLTDPHRHRANTVADHLSLALGNLRLRERLRTQSIRDPLTGLYNRRYMEESLDRELRRAGRRNTPVGVIMLDLDHFKSINDTFGHEAGDAALISLGAFLQSRVRQEDIACRYGGEEFVLILPDASHGGAIKWAERTRQAARDLQISHRLKALTKVSLSFGVAMFPDHGSTGESLLRAADRALYRAKQNGRDRVELASGSV